jgi:hypothetical protein
METFNKHLAATDSTGTTTLNSVRNYLAIYGRKKEKSREVNIKKRVER